MWLGRGSEEDVSPACAERGRLRGQLLVPVLVTAGLGAGFGREVLLATLYGTSIEVEIYRVATGIPGILSDSLAVSIVSVFIPMMLSKGTIAPDQYASVTKTGLTIGLLVFAVGVVTMPLQAIALAPGIEGGFRRDLIAVGIVCWVAFLFSFVALPLRAEQSIRGILWPGAASQFTKSTGIMGLLLMIVAGYLRPTALTAGMSFLLGSAAVLGVHVLGAGKRGRRFLREALHQLRTVEVPAYAMAAVSTLFVAQLLWNAGRLIDRSVASDFPQGNLAALEFSYALLMALGAVIGTSVNVVLAPIVGQSVSVRGRYPSALPVVLAAVTAGAIGIGLGVRNQAVALVSVVFQQGAFDDAATAATAAVLSVHAIGLGPLVAGLVMAQLLILRGKTRWLVPISLAKLIGKVLALVVFLNAGLGLTGVAWSLVAAETIAALALLGALRMLPALPDPQG